MGLRQRMAELIGKWDGADAADRPAQREQLLTDLIALLQNEPGASAQEVDRAAAPASVRLKRTA